MIKESMIEIGKWNKRLVLKKESHGFYLEGDEEWNDILLPNKNAPEGLKVGDKVEAFIYFDSEDTIIATTQKPKASVGEFAIMKVSQNTKFGSFLDWGIDKDLLVPFKEQLFKLAEAKSYLVYVYIDSSERIAATTRISKNCLRNQNDLKEGQEVEVIPFHRTDLGLKVLINYKYEGLIFREEPINNVQLGQPIKAFVKKIRNDGKIDISLSSTEKVDFNELEQIILKEIKSNGGVLDLTSKSSAAEINEVFGVSRNKFKSALGALYKKKIIEFDEGITKLIK